MQMPLISILTPYKNTSEYLTECLDSILNQSYKHWELCIVNDHSTDDSYKIVENYAKKDQRIKHFNNDGKGIIDALRLAFQNSKGQYITRMDSDDIMVPTKLEILLKKLLQHGKKHVAIGQVQYFKEGGVSNGYLRYEAWLNRLTSTGDNFSEIYKECPIPSPCWMIHRDDLIACDAFNPDLYPEDYDLTFRFYKHNFCCISCKKILHHWRDYDTRTSRTHEHYAQNYFLDIKLRYFLEIDYEPSRPLVVWGAGNKGKTIAKALVKQNIPFYWICNNPKKIGKQIYKQQLLPFENLEKLTTAQSIITVANENAQKQIKHYFESQNMQPMEDYFFFC